MGYIYCSDSPEKVDSKSEAARVGMSLLAGGFLNPRKSSPPRRHRDTENNLKIILTGYTGIAVNGGVTCWVKTKNQIFSVFSSVSPCLRGSIAVFRLRQEVSYG